MSPPSDAAAFSGGVPLSYPERNPFPFQGSMTVDGASALVTASAASTPTLTWRPVLHLKELVERYLKSYSPSPARATPGQGSGFPVVLHGAHGTGKTHAIRYIMGLVATRELRTARECLECLQIYARAENSDFLEVYRQIMRQVPPAMLRDMALRFLGMVSSEIFGDSIKSEEAKQRAADFVRANPNVVKAAFAQQLVGEDEAKEQQAREVRDTLDREENFHNVLGYLLRDDLGETARAWLVGEEVRPEDIKKLGVSAPIRSPAVARWGLRFLATIFGRGGRPLIITIDQYEKLVVRPDKTLNAENAGLLRSLVDEIANESGMLILGGSELAWSTLSQYAPDLKERFGNNDIGFPQLTLEQARELVSLYLTFGRYEVLQAWSIDSLGQTLFTLRGHALPIRSIVVAAEGARAISASKDSTIKVWDLNRRMLLRTLLDHEAAVNAVAVAPDGRTLASASDDRTVMVWDFESGQRRLRLEGHDGWVNGLAFTPDGERLVSASSDTTVRVWNLSQGRCELTLKSHSDTVWSVAVTPAGDRLVSASSDGTLRVWALPSGEELAELRGHHSWVNAVVVTPDGKRAVSASDDHSLRVWDLDSGACLNILNGHRAPVRALAMFPDGKQFLSASIDDWYLRWDVETGAMLTKSTRPSGNIISFAIVPGTTPRVLSGVSELRKRSAARDPEGAGVELYPFDEAAIRATLAGSGGNLRAFVQTCAEAFERALPARSLIDGELVTRVLAARGESHPGPAGVERFIERMIVERGFGFERRYQVNGATASLAVLGADGVPRMLVEVSGSLFHTDEAQTALANLNLIYRARGLPAVVVLVVAGYASLEVVALLGRVAHQVIVFDRERFESQFASVLDRLKPTLLAPAAPSADLGRVKEDLDAVKATLTQIASVRNKESANLDTQLREILDLQSVERSNKQREEARVGWAQERRALEERIRDARKARKKADLDEVEALRNKAELAYKLSLRYWWIASLVVVTAVVLLQVSQLRVFSSEGSTPLQIWLRELVPYALVSGAAMLYVAFSSLYLYQRRTAGMRLRFWDLASPVTSVEELDRQAAMVPKRPALARWLLVNANPQLRYAGAMVLEGTGDSDLLVKAIKVEPSRLVRRALARRLGRLQSETITMVLRDVPGKQTPELGYVVELAARSGTLQSEHVRELSCGLTTLALIADPRRARSLVTDYGNLADQLLLARESFAGTPYGEPMAKAFADGIQSLPVSLSRLPEQALSETLRVLSPFEPPGIGTLDELESIDRIDTYYLFFCQLRFYLERGLVDEPAREAGLLARAIN